MIDPNADYAPIVLFVFARPNHVRRTLDSLARNHLAAQSDLIIYADAAQYEQDAEKVEQVHQIALETTGFRSVRITERKTNFGLARNIIEGVTEVCNEYGRAIVLEDDMVTSPHFLTYMNQGLERFAHESKIISIHGYVYPVRQSLPEAFFLTGADCWGWATWQRGWALFNPDGQALLDELNQRMLSSSFDFNGAYPYTRMLENQIKGKNSSWAIRWYASAFLAGKMTLYPGRSLVHNIGNDSSGTHCRTSAIYDAELSKTPIDLSKVIVEPSVLGHASFEDFFRQSQMSAARKALQRVRQILRKFGSYLC